MSLVEFPIDFDGNINTTRIHHSWRVWTWTSTLLSRTLTALYVFIALVTVVALGYVIVHSTIGKEEEQSNPELVLDKIMNGLDASEKDFPYLVYIEVTSTGQICGGALISNNAVLTAAHCVKNKMGSIRSPTEFLAWTNEEPSSEATHRSSSVSRVHSHPDDEDRPGEFRTNDIAILILTIPLPLGEGWRETIDYLRVPDTQLGLIGKTVTLAGWGLLQYPDKYATSLQKTILEIVSCDSLNQPRSRTKDVICAKGNYSDACAGDSGTPIVWNQGRGKRWIVGITARGPRCQMPKPEFWDRRRPGVYIKLSRFTNWIEGIKYRHSPNKCIAAKGFYCSVDSRCILEFEICDGVPDCKDGADESYEAGCDGARKCNATGG